MTTVATDFRASMPAGSRPTLLVVDHDQAEARKTQRRLEQAGHHVVLVISGAEAIEWLAQQSVDLLILHHPLADMPVETLLAELVQRRTTAPFLVVASQGNEELAVRLMKQGARDYVPSDTNLLSRLPLAVEETLGQIAREREAAAARQRTEEQAEQLRLALGAAGMVTWESDYTTNQVTYDSDDMLGIFGVATREDLASSEDFVALIHPDDREKVLSGVDLTLQTGADYNVEFRVLRPDGTIRWMNARGQIHYDEHGRPMKMLGVSQDITERRRADAALREIVHGTADVTGVDFFESLVRHLAAALGVRWAGISEMIGSDGGRARVLAFWNDNQAGPHFEYEVSATACERTAREGLCHIPRGVHREFPDFPLYQQLGVESYLGVPLRDGSDAILGFLVVLHDRPMEFSSEAESVLRVFASRAAAELERKHAEEVARRRLAELAHVTRLGTMGEMISELAHEINQPLYAIGNFAEACVSTLQVNVPDTRREVLPWMQQILEQTRRVGQIVRRLGRYVRRTPPRRVRLDMNELVQDVIQFLEVDERWKALRVTVELEEPLPPVSGDRVQIEQVLVNLLLNAVDAMSDLEPAQRALLVRTAHLDDDWVKVVVRDNGRGIQQDRDLDKIFEPFFTTKPEGMGMGLAISRSLIQEHGGRLWATPNPDRGLTFRFTLPVRREEDGDDAE